MPGLKHVPHLSIASVIRQAPGAERIGGVLLLAWPTGPGTFEAPEAVEPALEAAATRAGWHVVLAGQMVHPIDTRPGLLAKLAVSALDHLPAREAGPTTGAPQARAQEIAGLWALRASPLSRPVHGPVVVRHQAWRAYGKAYDVMVAFGVDGVQSVPIPPWAEPLLADQPHASLLRAEGPADEVIAHVLALAIGQAASLSR